MFKVVKEGIDRGLGVKLWGPPSAKSDLEVIHLVRPAELDNRDAVMLTGITLPFTDDVELYPTSPDTLGYYAYEGGVKKGSLRYYTGDMPEVNYSARVRTGTVGKIKAAQEVAKQETPKVSAAWMPKKKLQGQVICQDSVPTDFVVEVEGAMKAHGSFININDNNYLFVNHHVCFGTGKTEPQVRLKITYYNSKLKTSTGPYSAIFKVIAQHEDALLLKRYTAKGVEVSPPVKPLKVEAYSFTYGALTLTLVGCQICGKPSVTDTVNMPTTDYRINTESGDCGRPVIYHDKYVGSGGVFFIIGEHA